MAGAKTKYDTHVKPYLKKINKKVREGVTEEEIAKALKISVASLNNYRNKYPAFAEALKKDKGTDVLDGLVNAGIKSACGYFAEETTTTYTTDEAGKQVLKQKVVNKRWFAPNAILNKFYVLNLGKAEGWADNPQELEIKKDKAELEKQQANNKNWLEEVTKNEI